MEKAFTNTMFNYSNPSNFPFYSYVPHEILCGFFFCNEGLGFLMSHKTILLFSTGLYYDTIFSN